MEGNGQRLTAILLSDNDRSDQGGEGARFLSERGRGTGEGERGRGAGERERGRGEDQWIGDEEWERGRRVGEGKRSGIGQGERRGEGLRRRRGEREEVLIFQPLLRNSF